MKVFGYITMWNALDVTKIRFSAKWIYYDYYNYIFYYYTAARKHWSWSSRPRYENAWLIEHDDIPPETILVTLEVISLYTNIPHEDGLEALRSHLNDQNCPSVGAIVALVRFILFHNYCGQILICPVWAWEFPSSNWQPGGAAIYWRFYEPLVLLSNPDGTPSWNEQIQVCGRTRTWGLWSHSNEEFRSIGAYKL